jgi:trk system potassium uptake protein TrkA
MKIIICGAGEVGRHAAAVLCAEGRNAITVIDERADRLAELENDLDARSLVGNGTHADVLVEAGCRNVDLFLAATHNDAINLLSSSVAKGLGARKCIARIHHGAYLSKDVLDYGPRLGIDHLVCPERSTAAAIAQALRTPGALAMERFARGQVEMQQLPVAGSAAAVGKPLASLGLPLRSRIASIERGETAIIPDSQTRIQAGDIVVLIADADVFERASAVLDPDVGRRRRVMILGGTAMGVWLCRALRSRSFSVRLIEPDERRADELAAKLDWVTVLRIDPADTSALVEERIDLVDAFVALTVDDEHNLLAAARAKSMGAKAAISVLQRPTYLHLLGHVGIDHAFSPRDSAVSEIKRLIQTGALTHVATLAHGIAEVVEIQVPRNAGKALGVPLSKLRFPAETMIAAIQHGDEAHVPSADDTIAAGDTIVAIGPEANLKELRKMFRV